MICPVFSRSTRLSVKLYITTVLVAQFRGAIFEKITDILDSAPAYPAISMACTIYFTISCKDTLPIFRPILRYFTLLSVA